MKKIFVAVPTLNMVPVKFVSSLIMLLYHHIDGAEIYLQIVSDSLTYTARDTLAQMAMDQECDYVLWIDSDMVFPADALERLLKHDKDMVTAVYYKRRGDHSPVIYCGVWEGEATTYYDFPKDGLFEVAGCGFGFVLTRTEVLKAVTERYHLLFHPMIGLGEDLSFCNRWLSCGGEIWCDPTIKLGHIGECVFTEEDWKKDVVR